MAVPKLRFKEFTGEWDRKQLKVLFDKITKKNTLNEVDNVISNSAQYGLVSQREFFLKDIANTDNTANYYVIEHDDFVYNPRKSKEAPYGPFNRYLCSDIGIVSPLYTCLRKKSDDSLDYLMFYFQSSMWHRYMYSNGNTGVRHDRVSINDDILMKLPVSLPKYEEQKKIADFLTTFDKRIATQQNIIADLEETKKGLLQKIFSQEIRFKDDNGQDYPDWEESTIGKEGYFYYGKSAPKWSITDDAQTPCIRYGELYTTHHYEVKEIKSYTNIERKNLRFSKGNEVLVPRVGEDPLDFHRCAYLPFKDVAIGEMISVYNTENNPLFISYCFNAIMTYKFARVVEGGNVSNLYYSYLENIGIGIPCMEEQQKIADFLSTFDKKITAEKQILSDLQEMKKGLLQQMFV